MTEQRSTQYYIVEQHNGFYHFESDRGLAVGMIEGLGL